MGRFDLARAQSVGIILPTQADIDKVAEKKESPLSTVKTALFNLDGKIRATLFPGNSVIERNMRYEGDGVLSDGQRLYDLDPKDYKTLEEKAGT